MEDQFSIPAAAEPAIATRAIDMLAAAAVNMIAEYERLKAINADLLAALKNYQNFNLSLQDRQNAAIAAIQKAEGRGPAAEALDGAERAQ